MLERVQSRATKWILTDYTSDYKSRLLTLNMLSLMMTFEVYDISFFLKSLSSSSVAFDILNYVSFNFTVGTRSSGNKLQHRFSRTNPSRHFYFSRLPRIWNSLLSLDHINLSLLHAVASLKHHFRSHFISNFDSSDPCSYHFMCPCSNCILSSSHL